MKTTQLITLTFLLLITGNCLGQSVAPEAPAKPEAPACACCAEPYFEFDFWLGDWEAFNSNGQLAGTNHIVKLQGGCVIQENWTSAKGVYSGTSYNYYDAPTKTWRQLWVDNQSGTLWLIGKKTGNQMILQSDPVPNPKGEMIINRITWTDNADGTVRQLWEVSKDDQSSWKTVFDGLYKKTKE